MGFKNCRPAVIVVCRYFQIPDFSITAIAACQLWLISTNARRGRGCVSRYEAAAGWEREMGEGNIRFLICRQEGRKDL